jgi:hypothetical protein
MSIAAAARVSAARKSHRWYYAAMGGGAIVLAFAGFAPSLLDHTRRLGPVTPLVAAHGALSALWLVFFVAQGFFIATRRTGLHRRLGVAAIGLAILLVATGYTTVVEQTRRGFDLSGDLNVKAEPAAAAVFPLGDLLTFTILIGAGLWHRRRPELHKRLMLMGTLGGMMPAALAHIVGHNFPSLPGLIVPLVGIAFLAPAVYDRLRFGHFNRVTIWGGILLFVWANLRAVLIGPSEAWHASMAWVVR